MAEAQKCDPAATGLLLRLRWLVGMSLLGWCVLLFVAARCAGQDVGPTEARQRDAVSNEISRLVGDLGHEDYLVRQNASERLLELGSAAIGPLAGARESFDEETRYRAAGLLERLEQEKTQNRVKQFLSLPENSMQTLGFEDWPGLAAICGNTPSARELLVAMYREETGGVGPARSLLNDARVDRWRDTCDLDQRHLKDPIAASCKVMYQRLQWKPPTVGERVVTDRRWAVIEYLGSDAFERNFLMRLPVAKVEQSEFKAPFKRLLTAYLNHEMLSGQLTLRKLKIINAYRLASFENRLIAAIRAPGYLHKLEAVETIANIDQQERENSDANHAADVVNTLSPWVFEREVVMTLAHEKSRGPVLLTLGDVVFQVILTRQGKSPTEFGMTPANAKMPLGGKTIFCFLDRSEALASINQWIAQQP